MHDFDEPGHYHENEEEHPMWRSERVELKTVGIDVGSSTSHLRFSTIVLRRLGVSLSSRFYVVKRETTYESPVLLTPYVDGNTIDAQMLSDFIEKSYREAGVTPDQIDTGAVISTGEAAKKENAENIVALFSTYAGKFVCATAGPNLEALMAAHGSGAVQHSAEDAEESLTVLNVDVGGGTAKLAVAQRGAVVDTAAINIGARLIALDEDRRINRVEDAGRMVAEHLGYQAELGLRVDEEQKAAMARALAESLFEVIERRPLSPLTEDLMITPPLSYTGEIDVLTFSGGVSEYIYDREKRDFGDMGVLLGAEVRQRAQDPVLGMRFDPSLQRIRATVIGASQYTVQVSGNTINVSRPDVLPVRNLQVVVPRFDPQRVSAEAIETAIGDAFRRFDLVDGEQAVAVVIHWPLGPAYELLRALGEGIVRGLRGTIEAGLPVCVVFDADIARLIGDMLTQELGVTSDVISIDGIDLQDFDFIDIGEEIPDVHAVPVVVKSLVFRPTVEKQPVLVGHHHNHDHPGHHHQ